MVCLHTDTMGSILRAFLSTGQRELLPQSGIDRKTPYPILRIPPVIAHQLASARELLRRSAFAADLEVAPRGLEAMVRQLAREVDLLAPAVDDDGRRPDNCEYPWEDDGVARHVPAEHGFGPLGTLLRHRAGATFLKIVAAALRNLQVASTPRRE